MAMLLSVYMEKILNLKKKIPTTPPNTDIIHNAVVYSFYCE